MSLSDGSIRTEVADNWTGLLFIVIVDIDISHEVMLLVLITSGGIHEEGFLVQFLYAFP